MSPNPSAVRAAVETRRRGTKLTDSALLNAKRQATHHRARFGIAVADVPVCWSCRTGTPGAAAVQDSTVDRTVVISGSRATVCIYQTKVNIRSGSATPTPQPTAPNLHIPWNDDLQIRDRIGRTRMDVPEPFVRLSSAIAFGIDEHISRDEQRTTEPTLSRTAL